jgi:hypothetical protein
VSTSCTDVGPGDYVKIGRVWKQIDSNTAYRVEVTPREWTVRTTDGSNYGMREINAYARAEEIES